MWHPLEKSLEPCLQLTLQGRTAQQRVPGRCPASKMLISLSPAITATLRGQVPVLVVQKHRLNAVRLRPNRVDQNNCVAVRITIDVITAYETALGSRIRRREQYPVGPRPALGVRGSPAPPGRRARGSGRTASAWPSVNPPEFEAAKQPT